MDVKGKVVLLTGASTGIGLATAELLADRGARLGLIARSKDKLRDLGPRLNDAWVIGADLSDLDAARSAAARALDHFGRIDVLVNNAGQGYDTSVERTDTPFEDGTVAFSDQAALWAPGPAGAGAGGREVPPPDPPELVARKILEAIESGEAEVFAHERMAGGRGSA